MKVTDYIAKYLKDYGIQFIFGFQGGAITPLIDSLVNQGIEYIQNYHEQASGFCADAYARITNDLGIAIVTNGPGVTNIISGIANSYFDSSPCLIISGQVNTFDMNTSSNLRQNGFQEINNIQLVNGITKYAVTVKNAIDIKYELGKAIYIATTGRKGAVLLDLPLDIQRSEIDETKLAEYKIERLDNKPVNIEEIVKLIRMATKPLVITGGGIQSSNSYEQFKKFALLTNIPNVSTLMGLDVITPISYGFSGLYGNTFSNLAIYNADLLIILGSRIAKRQIVNKEAYNRSGKIIHIDIDTEEIDHNINADISINCNVYDFLLSINEYFEYNESSRNNYFEWHKKINFWKKKYESNCHVNGNELDPVQIVEKISRFIEKEAIICTDVGQNQMWVAQGFKFKDGQRFLTSGGLGCMGFSLPSSIGAIVFSRDKKVIAFMGDGGFQMNLQELQLISQMHLPIKIIIFNNNSLGMIQEVQQKSFGERYYGTRIGYSAPDIKALANAYNIYYKKINNIYEVDSIKCLIEDDAACIIEIFLKQSPTLLLNKYSEKEIYAKNIF